MRSNSASQMNDAHRFNEALAKINIDGVGSNNGDHKHLHPEIKRSVAASYEHYGTESARRFASWGTFQFWNWGMYRQDLQHEITELLGDFDKHNSDGNSEQLYYYTLKRIPQADTTPRRILEVGCGNGAGLNFLSRLAGHNTFVGLDLSGAAVARANERYSRPEVLSYVQGDAEALPFDDGSFDAVINVESSHNYPDLAKFLSEVARVLRPGGHFSHVDVFTDARFAEMEQCKRDCADKLKWLAEEDITGFVKESVRRRMAPGSMLRRHLKDSLRSVPWPVDRMIAFSVMGTYGSNFSDDRRLSLIKLMPKRVSARWFVRYMSSYRHALAEKR